MIQSQEQINMPSAISRASAVPTMLSTVSADSQDAAPAAGAVAALVSLGGGNTPPLVTPPGTEGTQYSKQVVASSAPPPVQQEKYQSNYYAIPPALPPLNHHQSGMNQFPPYVVGSSVVGGVPPPHPYPGATMSYGYGIPTTSMNPYYYAPAINVNGGHPMTSKPRPVKKTPASRKHSVMRYPHSMAPTVTCVPVPFNDLSTNSMGHLETREEDLAAVSGTTRTSGSGTNKRASRMCKVEGCPNTVVQGGVCISHGAKRKQCKIEGCTKTVKQAGLCSAHGPARKRCVHEGCTNTAVQGGLCISHGARKRLCDVPGCAKKSKTAWNHMCKRHYDMNLLGKL